jgi:uncharacterized membrane protein
MFFSMDLYAANVAFVKIGVKAQNAGAIDPGWWSLL